MEPTIGKTVIYRLSVTDTAKINEYADSGGNRNCSFVRTGDEVPLIITKVGRIEWGLPGINGQIILDGNFSLWVTSVREGTEPGQWHWPIL